ncbi:isoprenoid synthase domain-containing protein [Lentinula raphanica]|nr:isoprenoid synthase domain-containing protein [Lentinula raphanica]
MSPFPAYRVATDSAPSYFSSFPVSTCEPDALPTIQKALDETISSCTTPGSKERKKAVYRHSNPAGNIFGLSLALCEADRVGYVVKLIEFLCIVDDVMEDLPFGEACREHSVLRQALNEDNDRDADSAQPVGLLKAFLRELRRELSSFDERGTPSLLKTLDDSLRDRDSDDSEFTTLAEYIPYRKTNFDYDFVCQLLRWAMDLPPAIQNNPLAKAYEHIIGVIVGLSNDYFSWDMERQEATDRIRNAVPVLMKEHSISEPKAKSMLKQLDESKDNHIETIAGHVVAVEV